ncbi:NUDIX domain-containing protein [Myceligenerans pegani]|uniref:NUDIX hydrolase n=1 Tax=Myceligenerans pegani TaxID=2776917 RepID=A0ABR9N6P1_9MICO|nr:NUDIX hydrolase [Myceligenerans sp. TRM 65318]MBE1878707.1 NUDIX hydrolase [Myceligenerans sp. TRM 65318]MBE3020978.1 NUDIX hydrolase [Myceligenerans sp. TRM 65318]
MDLLPFDEYVASLPRKRMSAGVLLRGDAGRVVLIEPSYKAHWDIPGGVVDDDEAPWRAAARELSEELGLVRTRMPLLVIDHVSALPDGMPEGIAWVFDGGRISEAELGGLDLTDPEIVSVGLYALDEAAGKMSADLARRVRTALHAVEQGTGPVLCDDGTPASW